MLVFLKVFIKGAVIFSGLVILFWIVLDYSNSLLSPSLSLATDVDPVEILERVLGYSIGDSAASCFLTDFDVDCRRIQNSKGITPIRAKEVMKSINHKVMASTNAVSKSIGDYHFDGLVRMVAGQSKSTLQFVSKGSRQCVAKISTCANVEKETKNAEAVCKIQECNTVAEVIETLFIDGNRSALIMPCYTTTISTYGGNMNVVGMLNVLFCGLATIKAFKNAGRIHGDLKPDNFMMTHDASNIVIAIDFGASVLIDGLLVESSKYFPLDSSDANESYDLACLATTLHYMATGTFVKEMATVIHLKENIANEEGIVYRMIEVMVGGFVVEDVWRNCVDLLNKSNYSGSGMLVNIEAIYPKLK